MLQEPGAYWVLFPVLSVWQPLLPSCVPRGLPAWPAFLGDR